MTKEAHYGGDIHGLLDNIEGQTQQYYTGVWSRFTATESMEQEVPSKILSIEKPEVVSKSLLYDGLLIESRELQRYLTFKW